MISSTLLSRLVDMGSWCYTIAILHPVPGACLMNSLTCLERSHKTDLLWAKANASPKTQNTTVEQSLRSDTSNSRSSEYILYSYTTRFNLAVWRGSLVEAKYTDLYKFSRLSKTPARSTLFQADFDIVMYVNYNILYLRSCIYCMYLSIGVAMGNWDFSCTSNKGWPGILIETISFAIFSHFGLFGLHVLLCFIPHAWYRCRRGISIWQVGVGRLYHGLPWLLDAFGMRPTTGGSQLFPAQWTNICKKTSFWIKLLHKTYVIALVQFNSNRFSPEFWRLCTLSLSLSPSSQGTELNMSSFQMCSFQVDALVVSTKVYGASQGSMTQGKSGNPKAISPFSRAKYNVE